MCGRSPLKEATPPKTNMVHLKRGFQPLIFRNLGYFPKNAAWKSLFLLKWSLFRRQVHPLHAPLDRTDHSREVSMWSPPTWAWHNLITPFDWWLQGRQVSFRGGVSVRNPFFQQNKVNSTWRCQLSQIDHCPLGIPDRYPSSIQICCEFEKWNVNSTNNQFWMDV